jgi:hypothetical protein
MYSNVNDMLKYANSVLEAEKQPTDGPLKNIRMLQSNQVPLDNPSRDYPFYGMGVGYAHNFQGLSASRAITLYSSIRRNSRYLGPAQPQ